MLTSQYLNTKTSSAPLVVFRMCFGLMLVLSIVRFGANGWIEDLYIKPLFYFPFYGFEFVKPLGYNSYYLFALCGLSAFFVALGLWYRLSSIVLFLSFTYIELIDKTTYLNHYYFISLICFLMIFMPANVSFSVDSFLRKKTYNQIPTWTVDAIKLMVCMLYFFAGLAKVNHDWLIDAIPLKIWLPARNDMPVIGWLFDYKTTAYIFSWVGCVYDLLIPFMLWNKRTRLWAYLAVVVFHVLTSMLFPIGMFPYIMIVTALVFFSSDFHSHIISWINKILRVNTSKIAVYEYLEFNKYSQKTLKIIFILFFLVQLILPFRYLFYPGNLFWTEQGFRFSWRVMLIEKAGMAEFTVKDKTGKRLVVNNRDFLTTFQEKMMSTQPDMILQYAHFLGGFYANSGFKDPEVYVDSYVALNGKMGRPLVNSKVDLMKEKESLFHKKWILLYND